ncbi:MAG: DUF4349 domain-containing protein [Aphanocapsa sp. GSE-SYN-MK-11-07L]|nr:DUF4349 domain-containing protein [Aphanocapsa sp. GSE-SYN-MK-11-07L]
MPHPLLVRPPKSVMPALAIGLVLGVTACGAAPNSLGTNSGAPQAMSPTAGPADNAEASPLSQQPDAQSVKPQLIRTASLRLSIRSIDQTMTEIRSLLKQQQGDIYNFNDTRGNENNERRVSLEIKVPQQNLDQTIAALSKFGTVLGSVAQ